MKIDFREFTNRLALGELKNTGAVDEANPSEILAQHRRLIEILTNQGLRNLYSRFILLERELVLRTEEPYAFYYLRPEFAQTNTASLATLKYIDDTVTPPYTGGLVKVLTIWDSNGCEIAVGDKDDPYSFHQPEFDCLQIPRVWQGRVFSVIYQAIPDGVSKDDPCSEINIPQFLEEALQLFVAGKYLTQMNGPEHTMKGESYLAASSAILMDAESRDLASTSVVSTGHKLCQRGFI